MSRFIPLIPHALGLISTIYALPQNRAPAASNNDKEEGGIVRGGIAWAERNRYIVAAVLIGGYSLVLSTRQLATHITAVVGVLVIWLIWRRVVRRAVKPFQDRAAAERRAIEEDSLEKIRAEQEESERRQEHTKLALLMTIMRGEGQKNRT